MFLVHSPPHPFARSLFAPAHAPAPAFALPSNSPVTTAVPACEWCVVVRRPLSSGRFTERGCPGRHRIIRATSAMTARKWQPRYARRPLECKDRWRGGGEQSSRPHHRRVVLLLRRVVTCCPGQRPSQRRGSLAFPYSLFSLYLSLFSLLSSLFSLLYSLSHVYISWVKIPEEGEDRRRRRRRFFTPS